jgi:hypothetical protein
MSCPERYGFERARTQTDVIADTTPCLKAHIGAVRG